MSLGIGWEIADYISKNRMNTKTLFYGTATELNSWADKQTGSRAQVSSSGSGFASGERYWWTGSVWQHEFVAEDIEVYPHSTTIGDYAVSPVAATVSSSDPSVFQTTDTWGTTTSGNFGLRSGSNTRAAMKITNTAKRNKQLVTVRFKLSKNGTPTGTINVRCRKTSDDSIVGTATTAPDASTLTGTPTNTDFSFAAGVFTPNEDFYLTIEFSGGSAGNEVKVDHAADETPYSGGTAWVYTGSWAAFGADIIGNFVYSDSGPASLIDGSTSTVHQSNNEIGPWVKIEMAASADKEPAAIALWTHSNTTATQIKIELSDDDATYTQVRLINVSLLTHGQYNYIRFNRPTKQHRYLKITGTDGSAKILATAEIKILSPTESQWNRRHGHKLILSTEVTIALAG